MRTQQTSGLLPFPANPQPGELPFPVEDHRDDEKALRVVGAAPSKSPRPEFHRHGVMGSGSPQTKVLRALKLAARLHLQGADLVLHFGSEISRTFFVVLAKNLSESDIAEIRAIQAGEKD